MDAFAKLKERFRTDERCVEASCKDDEVVGTAPGGKMYPPSRSQIGRASWRYVHAMAANSAGNDQNSSSSVTTPFPPEKQDTLRNWLVSFIQFYPCQHCAEAFVDVISAKNPDLSNAQNYSKWWVWAHNMVRKDLSQEIEIDAEKDYRRWFPVHKEGKVFGSGAESSEKGVMVAKGKASASV